MKLEEKQRLTDQAIQTQCIFILHKISIKNVEIYMAQGVGNPLKTKKEKKERINKNK